MNHREQVLHNAKLILPHVRGKSVKERRQFYVSLAMGPLLVSAEIVNRVWIDGRKEFDAEFDQRWAEMRQNLSSQGRRFRI